MGLSSILLKFLSKKTYKKVQANAANAIESQDALFKYILKKGSGSLFCRDYGIYSNVNYSAFSNLMPISNYENYLNYISLISRGEKNILTRGAPKYFAISSGTTSGTKYIPLTSDMMRINTRSIAELLLLYAHQTNTYSISYNSGMMFIQGSPELKYLNKIPFGKLSGISARHVPFFLKNFRYPSMATNCINDWNKKIESIVTETFNKNLRVLGGIPPWVMTYFDALLKYTKKPLVKSVFPNLNLYIHGGTGFSPYRDAFLNMCGPINTLEVYPASEGFFGYQNMLDDPSMLLLTSHGVFYEFIPLEDFKKNINNRLPLEGIDVNIDYVLIVSTISGLWAYNTGDTVRFTSKDPYKIIFSGRSSQYCSAFGEHVIEKEVQSALVDTISVCGGEVLEFTVCPKIHIDSNLSCHEWFIEFRDPPKNISEFEKTLNKMMESQNIYYKDLILSKVISELKVRLVKRGGFNEYMKSIGKFGGQNKCPHLSNNRDIADFLLKNNV